MFFKKLFSFLLFLLLFNCDDKNKYDSAQNSIYNNSNEKSELKNLSTINKHDKNHTNNKSNIDDNIKNNHQNNDDFQNIILMGDSVLDNFYWYCY
ncbi:MAG: hypothetical protein GY830_00260 [Bacteroidetes bacterium]|nr:hypothetical protein [Bacteroidota bacterium]